MRVQHYLNLNGKNIEQMALNKKIQMEKQRRIVKKQDNGNLLYWLPLIFKERRAEQEKMR